MNRSGSRRGAQLALLVGWGTAAAHAATNHQLIVVESTRLLLPISAQAAFTAEGLAAGVPGVTASSQGYRAPQSDLHIRGSAFNTTGFTLGGLALRNSQTEHFNADLPLPAEWFQTPRLLTGLEQFRQSAGHPSGSLALDWAPAQPGVNATLGAGAWGQRFLNATATGLLPVGAPEPLALSAFFSQDRLERSDGQPDNDLERWQAGGRVQQRRDDTQADFVAALARRRFGARGFYGAPASFPSEEQVADVLLLGTLTGELAEETPGRFSASWRRVEDRYWLDRRDHALYANHHVSDLAALHGDAALPVNDRVVLDTRLDASLERLASVYQGTLPGQGLGDHQRRQFTAALIPVYSVGAWRLRAGGAAATCSGDDPAWLPAAGVEYELAPGQTLVAAYTEAVRQPSYTELNYESPGSLGNAGLERQEVRGAEGGWRLQAGALRAQATLFAEQGDNVVDWIKQGPGARWTAVNLDTVKTRGIDLSAACTLLPGTAVTGDYRAIDKDGEQAVYASRYALDYARHEARLGVQTRLARGWSAAFWQGLAHYAGNPERGGSDTRAEAGAELRYLHPRLRTAVTLGASNLLDDDFQLFPGQPPAGRRWYLALTQAW